MKKILAVLLLLLISLSCFADEDTAAETDIYPDLLPEPYDASEYPEWTIKARRAAVVFVGSYPLSVFFTKLGKDFYDYAAHNFDSEHSPAILGGGGSSSRSVSKREIKEVTLAALAVSGAVTVADFIIQQIKEKKHPERFQEQKMKRAAKLKEKKLKKEARKAERDEVRAEKAALKAADKAQKKAAGEDVSAEIPTDGVPEVQ
ncbi:MAG: hypothetical protein MJ215_03090 [Spirochaetia bacterium]|nr:hypothetical protein [Spirochaetia bacterium]